MEGYRYQQFVYLIIPLLTGAEFFRCARAERKKRQGEWAGAVAMDVCGYAFMVFIPFLFLFTIFSIEYRRLTLFSPVLHRFDRYGVMFFFFGAWWQIFLITALRARRAAGRGASIFSSVWLPYLALGAFISALVLWVAPFNLMWFSFFWFVASFGVLAGAGTSATKVSKIFFILAVVVLISENIFFIIVDAIV